MNRELNMYLTPWRAMWGQLPRASVLGRGGQARRNLHNRDNDIDTLIEFGRTGTLGDGGKVGRLCLAAKLKWAKAEGPHSPCCAQEIW